MPKYIIFLFVLFFTTSSVFASTSSLVNFNDTSDLENNFTSDGSEQFSNSANGGINDSGSIVVPLGSNDVWTTKQGYSVSGAGDKYVFSAYFKIQANSGYGGLGFTTNPLNEGDSQGSPATSLGMSFHGGGGAFVNNRNYSNVSWPPDLEIGNWYKMILEINAKGDNTYDLKFQIWNTNDKGVLGTLKTEKTLNNVVNESVGSAKVIYGYFSAAGSRMANIDDFEMNLEGDVSFINEGEPVVITTSVSDVSYTTATSGGNVTDDRGSSVTARGVCWSTSTNPTINDNCTVDGTGEGLFSSSISGLSASTTYYLRSYATNSIGTSYGSQFSFSTLQETTPPEISNIQVSTTGDSAQITWDTDEPATSLVYYGVTPLALDSVTSNVNVTNHSIDLTNLKVCSKYFYTVTSVDSSSNSKTSTQSSFYTKGCSLSNIQTGITSDSYGQNHNLVFNFQNNSLRLIAPEGFYSSKDTALQINLLNTLNLNLNTDDLSLIANNLFQLLAFTEDDDNITSFQEPITLILTYDSLDINFINAALDLYKYSNGKWIPQNCTHDVELKQVTCSMNGFSTYALLADVASQNDNNTDSNNDAVKIVETFKNTFKKDKRCHWSKPDPISWIKATSQNNNDKSGLYLEWSQMNANKISIYIDDGTNSFPWIVYKTLNDGNEFLENVQGWQSIKIKAHNNCSDGDFSSVFSLNKYPNGFYNK